MEAQESPNPQVGSCPTCPDSESFTIYGVKFCDMACHVLSRFKGRMVHLCVRCHGLSRSVTFTRLTIFHWKLWVLLAFIHWSCMFYRSFQWNYMHTASENASQHDKTETKHKLPSRAHQTWQNVQESSNLRVQQNKTLLNNTKWPSRARLHDKVWRDKTWHYKPWQTMTKSKGLDSCIQENVTWQNVTNVWQMSTNTTHRN